jgi:hypothetical protein
MIVVASFRDHTLNRVRADAGIRQAQPDPRERRRNAEAINFAGVAARHPRLRPLLHRIGPATDRRWANRKCRYGQAGPNPVLQTLPADRVGRHKMFVDRPVHTPPSSQLKNLDSRSNPSWAPLKIDNFAISICYRIFFHVRRRSSYIREDSIAGRARAICGVRHELLHIRHPAFECCAAGDHLTR